VVNGSEVIFGCDYLIFAGRMHKLNKALARINPIKNLWETKAFFIKNDLPQGRSHGHAKACEGVLAP
jgi:hypothetical protein